MTIANELAKAKQLLDQVGSENVTFGTDLRRCLAVIEKLREQRDIWRNAAVCCGSTIDARKEREYDEAQLLKVWEEA
jgi:hypothetical protein